MDTEKLTRWLTLGANIAILAGIVFLAFEFRQNTNMMQTQINQSRAELSMFEAEAMYNSAYIPEILVKLRLGEPISDVEAENISQ